MLWRFLGPLCWLNDWNLYHCTENKIVSCNFFVIQPMHSIIIVCSCAYMHWILYISNYTCGLSSPSMQTFCMLQVSEWFPCTQPVKFLSQTTGWPLQCWLLHLSTSWPHQCHSQWSQQEPSFCLIWDWRCLIHVSRTAAASHSRDDFWSGCGQSHHMPSLNKVNPLHALNL